MIKYAGVVVLYNPDEQVLDNISSYIKYLDRLYLIDNSEEYGFEFGDRVQKKFLDGNFEYINMKGNKGIASALNIGIEKASRDGFNWILTMDQDSAFSTNIIAVYDKYLQKYDCENVAILSPYYKTGRNEERVQGEFEQVYWTMQSANLINLNIFSRLGGFREEYFIDCVDYEYCLRVKQLGYRIIRCNNAILIHSPAITHQIKIGTKVLKYGVAPPLRIYYQVRNALYMFSEYKNVKSIGIVIIKLMKIILLFGEKRKYLRYFTRAIADYRAGITGKASF